MSTAAQDDAKRDGNLGEQAQESTDATSASGEGFWQSLGGETRKTVTYASIAAVCLALTFVIEFASRPEEISEYGKVGDEFFPEFTDPTRDCPNTCSQGCQRNGVAHVPVIE